MLREAVLLGLVVLITAMVSAEDVTPTMTTVTTGVTETSNSTFVTIGSNQPSAASNESVGGVVPIVHAISAQARKIEMAKLNSVVGGDVTSALKTPSGSNASSMAIGTTGIAIIVAVIAILIVTVLVGTAIFVMRRRFSVWRLNGSKQNLNGGVGDGGESGGTSGTGSVADEKAVVVVSTTSSSSQDENPNEQITSVENKNAVVNVNVVGSEDGEKAVTETPTETVDDANKEIVVTNEGSKQDQEAAAQPLQDVSSQSLIVNVLNELSDSVAKKVDEAIKTEEQDAENKDQKQPTNE